MRQTRLGKTEDRQVCGGVISHKDGIKLAPIDERGLQPAGAGHDMAVGQGISVGRKNYPGPRPGTAIPDINGNMSDSGANRFEGLDYAVGIGIGLKFGTI